MTKKNRRGRGVVAGTPSSGSESTEQASQSTTGDREQPPLANGNGGSALHREGVLSRVDVRLRQAYEPGWYRVLASEPAEHSVREDPPPAESAESTDPEPTDHTAPDTAGSRS